MLLITGGAATLAVDFVDHRLIPGSVLWTKPGQVQQFGNERLAGDLVIFQPDFLIPGTGAATVADDPLRHTSVHNSPAHSSTDRARQGLRRAYAEVARRGEPTATETETLQHLLSVLILRLAPARQAPQRPIRPGSTAAFASFSNATFGQPTTSITTPGSSTTPCEPSTEPPRPPRENRPSRR